jgi:regulator of protease activity HflC (stomatin/prohibitin superfamily)
MLELLNDLVNLIVLLILVVFLFVAHMKLSQVCSFLMIKLLLPSLLLLLPSLISFLLSGKVSLRVQQLDVSCETKTLDNVFVMVQVSVQYQVVREKVYQSYYALSSPEDQMRSYIYDTLRASICALTLDQAFDSKDEISLSLKQNLEAVFLEYGFGICQALVTDISPNNRVRDAMNEINSSMRIKEASYQRAEGEKVLKVKRAEAEAESMHLQGVGVARSRHAIMDGLKYVLVFLFCALMSHSSSRLVLLFAVFQGQYH